MTDPDAELIARLRRMSRTAIGDLSLGTEAADRLEALRNALIQIDRLINMNRIWGGMGWKYLQAPPYRVEKIAKLCRKALDPKWASLFEDPEHEEPTDAA